MKSNFENFASLSAYELMETNGGGFAFDAGRVIRFIGIALPFNGPRIVMAMTDWQINAMVNDLEQK